MNIPTIPGLQPHPVQVAEQQRIAALRPEGAPAGSPDAQRTTSSLMSDNTREALRKTAQALRKAGGIADPPPAAPSSTGSNPSGPAPRTPPGRRADSVQPPSDGTPRRAVP
jgi:penicillin-binding protein 1A